MGKEQVATVKPERRTEMSARIFWTPARREALAGVVQANPTWRVPQIWQELRQRRWQVTLDAVAHAVSRAGLKTPRGRIPKEIPLPAS
jgi:hypothetical protein